VVNSRGIAREEAQRQLGFRALSPAKSRNGMVQRRFARCFETRPAGQARGDVIDP
jgi:hypothetical protein